MNNREPLVSVIMNCFNGGEYLQEAIESVLQQKYKNWELIFWDNQSTDNSAEIINSFNDVRIKYYYAPFHTNLAVARNNAIEKATGEWIGFLDTDDIWLPSKLDQQISKIQPNSNVGLIYGYAIGFGKNINEFLIPSSYPNKLPVGNIFNNLLYSNFIGLPTALILKKAFKKIGEIPKQYVFASDYWIFLNISLDYSVDAVQYNCARVRIHSNNWTKRQKSESVIEPIEIVWKITQKLDSKILNSINKYKLTERISNRIILLLLWGFYKNFFMITQKYSNIFFVVFFGILYLIKESLGLNKKK